MGIDDSGAHGGNAEVPLGARITCPGCGVSFPKVRRNKRFCSRACAKRHAALTDPARDDPEFRKVVRERKARENARIRERLDRVAETFVTCRPGDKSPDEASDILEHALQKAHEGGDLRQALRNQRLIHDIGSRAELRGVGAKRSRDHRIAFLKALRQHCWETRGMSLEDFLARPRKRPVGGWRGRN